MSSSSRWVLHACIPHAAVEVTTLSDMLTPVFLPVPLCSLTAQALQQLKARLSKGGAELPSEDTLQWFLRDRCDQALS